MLTLKGVNAELKRRGYAEELVRGEGYFWFDGPTLWPRTAVYVYRLNHLTLDQWVAALDELRAQEH
jgi:hypothetical protein